MEEVTRWHLQVRKHVLLTRATSAFFLMEKMLWWCVLFTSGYTEHKLYSFGLGQFGQLGHGTFIFESRLPRVVEHFRRGRVKHVECGENHTAVVTGNLHL